MSIPYLYKKGRAGRQSSITVTVEGKTFPIVEGTPHFDAILTALKNGDDNVVRQLVKLKNTIAEYAEGMVEIVNGELLFNGKPLHGTLVDRILAMLKEGNDIKPMTRFLQKCMENPLKSAIEELYLFLEACNLPIVDDGDFLAYKVINHNWTDCHTGKMDNSIGATPSMPREQCDTNRNATCSSGLHFCSRGYISGFKNGNNRLVVVKVNPKNVTSIPSDHNNEKGRACEYFIKEEIIGDTAVIKPWYAKSSDDVIIDEVPEDDNSEECEDIPYVQPQDTVVKPSKTLANNPSAKLDADKVRKIRKQLADNWKPSVIAIHFGVHRRSIERIRDGEAWTHVK